MDWEDLRLREQSLNLLTAAEGRISKAVRPQLLFSSWLVTAIKPVEL